MYFKKDIEKVLNELKEYDEQTYNHSRNVGIISYTFGKHLELPNYKEEFLIAGLLHDVGKIFIPKDILCKPKDLTPKEYEIMKKHTEYGYNYLRNNNLEYFADVARYHHERWDGCGYNNLNNNKLSSLIWVISLVDTVAAMSEKRYYKKELSLTNILKEIRNCSGKQFNPQICSRFEKIICNSLNVRAI